MKRNHNESGGRPPSAEHLEAELAQGRQVADVHRTDELERKQAEALHGRRLADVAEQARRAELDRIEREEQARADTELARMYRTFRAAGLRTRITAQMARSGEARALRLERLRVLNLKVLIPVLLGFAAWSTTGVHHGAARLIGIDPANVGEPMWWALWLLEPVLIGAVVWIIIVRARLAASGGHLDPDAWVVGIGCLGTSVLLNFSAAVPAHGTHPGVWAVIGSMIAHGIAPGGAAATAHLVGIIDASIATADPWTDKNGEPVPRLAEMDLHLPTPAATIANDGQTEDPDEEQQAQTTDPQDEPGAEQTPFAESVAAWLADQDPPEDGGVTSSSPRPDGDGPQDAAEALSGPDEGATVRAGQIDRDQGQDKTGPASAARRARGVENRRRVADHMARYPDATTEQIAAALRLSVRTVKRHRRAIRSGQ